MTLAAWPWVESAGGNLAAVTSLLARDRGVRLPVFIVLQEVGAGTPSSPGAVGSALVNAGVNTTVRVRLTRNVAANTPLLATLHADSSRGARRQMRGQTKGSNPALAACTRSAPHRFCGDRQHGQTGSTGRTCPAMGWEATGILDTGVLTTTAW